MLHQHWAKCFYTSQTKVVPLKHGEWILYTALLSRAMEEAAMEGAVMGPVSCSGSLWGIEPVTF